MTKFHENVFKNEFLRFFNKSVLSARGISPLILSYDGISNTQIYIYTDIKIFYMSRKGNYTALSHNDNHKSTPETARRFGYQNSTPSFSLSLSVSLLSLSLIITLNCTYSSCDFCFFFLFFLFVYCFVCVFLFCFFFFPSLFFIGSVFNPLINYAFLFSSSPHFCIVCVVFFRKKKYPAMSILI